MLTTATICSGFFFLVGLGIVLSGVRTYTRSKQISNWLITTGTVKVSEVKRSGGTKIEYHDRIIYDYTVMGTDYTSNTVTVADLMGIVDNGLAAAQAKVQKFPAGSTVTVYYDPEDPRRSVIQKGGDSSLFILGGIFMVVGIVFFLIQ